MGHSASNSHLWIGTFECGFHGPATMSRKACAAMLPAACRCALYCLRASGLRPGTRLMHSSTREAFCELKLHLLAVSSPPP